MTKLNVTLLREAQKTILDPKHAFDMNSWGCCIAGHIVHAHACHEPANNSDYMMHPASYAANLAGIPFGEAEPLFASAGTMLYTRGQAAARIDRLIETYATEPEPAPEPVKEEERELVGV